MQLVAGAVYHCSGTLLPVMRALQQQRSLVSLNMLAGSAGHCMRGSMEDFPADADSVVEAVKNAKKVQEMEKVMCYSMSINAGSIFMVVHSITFTS